MCTSKQEVTNSTSELGWRLNSQGEASDWSRGWALTDESGEPTRTGDSGILRRRNKGCGAVAGVEEQIRKGQGDKVKTGFLVQPRSKQGQLTMHCLHIATSTCSSSCSGDD